MENKLYRWMLFGNRCQDNPFSTSAMTFKISQRTKDFLQEQFKKQGRKETEVETGNPNFKHFIIKEC